MKNTRLALLLALASLTLVGCRAEEPAPAPTSTTAPDDDVDIHEELGIETGQKTVDPEPFLAVLPFRTDIDAALADIAAGDKPGMLYYADPT